MILAPQLSSLFRQLLLVDFADLFEDPPQPVEVVQLPTDLRNLRGMEANLASLAPGVVDVENPLQMALAISAGGTGNRSRMERVALKERAAKDVVEGRKRSEELAEPGRGLLEGCPVFHPSLVSHLYR
jgi:hypothetical protein